MKKDLRGVVLADRRLIAPALGASLAGVPVGLPAGAGAAVVLAAPPVVATALAAKQSDSSNAAEIVTKTPAHQGRGLLLATCPLFPSPTELAVGLALKEMRYDLFGRFAPGTCNGSCGSSAPGPLCDRDSAFIGAAV